MGTPEFPEGTPRSNTRIITYLYHYRNGKINFLEVYDSGTKRERLTFTADVYTYKEHHCALLMFPENAYLAYIDPNSDRLAVDLNGGTASNFSDPKMGEKVRITKKDGTFIDLEKLSNSK